MFLTESERTSILEKLNIPEDDWISSKVEIRKSPLQGRGMFAKEEIEKGEVVVIWGATATNIFTEDEIRAGKARKHSSVQIEDGLYLAGEIDDPNVDSDLINHSCDSNTWMQNAVTLIARRDIKTGEELTVDYALWETDEKWMGDFDCKCSTQVCRKQITGNDWKLHSVQQRYKGHFSPFLNRKIENLSRQ